VPERYEPLRLDRAVVTAGLAPTRSRARDLIKRGFVLLDGTPVTKAGAIVAQNTSLALADDAPRTISRGGEKLAAALAAFDFDATDRVALDVGSSTGGFTERLLAEGAAKVYAVDVGTGQLHPDLRADARVISLEKTDARILDRNLVAEPVTAIVADVSFISVLKVLPACLVLAAPATWLVVLVKPQFEAGRSAVGKRGIVTDPQARKAAVDRVAAWIADQTGWHLIGVQRSPIAGADGNEEFLLGARYDEPRPAQQ
jgi:23S rRNA (cytidine1920-2'-O)/16S rRNA (cytidine1409-2'-O)-methyltransferase